ncbi:MAG TPA: hypothetical protein PKC22_04935, partial [Rhodocyclaceae bacterium]|nr:hypothetical protein [Rhodocyclaceae bacterium]
IAVEACIVGIWIWMWLILALAAAGLAWHRLADALIPFAGANLFVGLSLLTTAQLSAEGLNLPWAHTLRMTLLVLVANWCVTLAWRMAKRRRAVAALGVGLAAALPLAAWAVQFWYW